MCRSIKTDHGMGGSEASPTVQRQCGGCRLGDPSVADDLPRSEESPEPLRPEGNGQSGGAVQREVPSVIPPNQPSEEWLASHGQADGLGDVCKVHSDSVQVFSTGAVRSALVERLDLVPFAGIRRVGLAMAHGAEKYGEKNWEKGFPIESILNHALVHIYRYLSGDRSEDHLGHAAANLLMACHTEENPNGVPS